MRKLKDALAGSSPFHLGARLIFLFAVLSSLILGGNLLLIWQFHLARLQSDRLTGESQQLIAILRLQEALRSFHQRLDELVQQQDDASLRVGAGAIRSALIDSPQGPGPNYPAEHPFTAALASSFPPALRDHLTDAYLRALGTFGIRPH